MILLFSELALLLPYIDITLVMFGHAVHDLVRVAKEKHPKSIAAVAGECKPPCHFCISPSACGSSTLNVYLREDVQFWAIQHIQEADIPDALVAPHAGLTEYTAYYPVVAACIARDLPFACTDYYEEFVEKEKATLPYTLAPGMKQLPTNTKGESQRRMKFKKRV